MEPIVNALRAALRSNGANKEEIQRANTILNALRVENRHYGAAVNSNVTTIDEAFTAKQEAALNPADPNDR